jgi:hypothetical protein
MAANGRNPQDAVIGIFAFSGAAKAVGQELKRKGGGL